MKISALRRWIDCTIEQILRSVEVDSRLKLLIEILKTSTKNDRTEFQKMEIRKYIVANLNCPSMITSCVASMITS